MDFDSVEKKTLSPEEDDFFATSGQNGNSVTIASQGLTRVTKAIRDRMNMFGRIDVVFEFPGLKNARGGWFRPVLFRVTYWENWEDIGKKERIHHTSLFLFSRRAAFCYNTSWFAGKKKMKEPELWSKYMEGTEIDERFTQSLDEFRSSGLWAVAQRAVVSSWKRIKVCYFDLCSYSRSQICQKRVFRIFASFAARLSSRIFHGSHSGRKRLCSSHMFGRRSDADNSRDPNSMDHSDRSDTVRCETVVQHAGVFSRNDQAAESESLQPEQGLALEGVLERLETSCARSHSLHQASCYPGNSGGYEHEDSDTKMAGNDHEETE